MAKFHFSIILFLAAYTVMAQDLAVMTYNIRLNWGTDENRWDNRKELLADQIRFYEPDLLGIQEGLPEQVDYLDSALSDYSYIGVGREDGARKGEFSAIFFKKKKYKLVNGSTFWLSETPETPSKGWDAALPRVCTYGQFEDRSGKRFWVFNTHFDHVGDVARVESMRLILAKIKEYNKQNLPVVLMGDLNITPDQPPIAELKKELKDTREVAAMVFGPNATFNGFDFANKPEKRIDYIAVNNRVRVNKYAVLTESYEQRYISDHFAVFCTLSFN